MTGADSESGTTSAPTNSGIKCSRFPGENIRKVYSKFDGSVVRTLCAECLFQDPEFVQNNKTDLYDVSVYVNKLSQMISQMGGNLDNLRHSVPQHATDFLEKGDSIGELFGQFSLIEFTKLKNLVTMHTDKIVEMVEIMIQGYRELFDQAEAQVKKNIEHVSHEINTRYQLSANWGSLTKEKLISELQTTKSPTEFLKDLESHLQPGQLDKSCIDAYIGTLLNRSEKVLESPPKVALDSGLETKLNSMVQSVASSLQQIDAHIKTHVLQNVKVADLSQQISFKPGVWKSISADGLCGKYDFDENRKIQLKLANKILSVSPAPLTCLANTPEWGLIAAGSSDGKVILYNTDLGEAVGTVGNHKDKVTAISVSKGKNGILQVISGCASESSAIQIATLQPVGNTTEPIREVTGAHRGGVTCLASLASPNKTCRYLLSGGSDGSIGLVDLWSGPNNSVYKPKQNGHTSAVISIKEVSTNKVVSVGKEGTVCLWSLKFSTNPSSPQQVAVEMELQSKIDRKQTIESVFCRNSSEAEVQVILVLHGGRNVEVIDMINLVLDKQFELPSSTQNAVLLEHLYRDGKFDFQLLDTAVPGEPAFLGDPLYTSTNYRIPIVMDPLTLSQGSQANQPCGPRVQLVQLNKKSIRLAKIGPTTLGVSCINFYDLVQV